jgi:hypothetical protein
MTDRQSATVFLALTGGIPSNISSDRLVREHMSFEYDTPYLIHTLGKGDPAFNDQLPWRGRVSPLLNVLICEGLRQFGFDELAETITLSSLDLLNRGWNNHHQVFGSYNAKTGRGDDIEHDPLAPTGILLGSLGITMLLDAEPWDGLRMGNLHGVDMGITGFPLHGAIYDVASGPWGFSIARNGELWIDFDRPAILRNLTQTQTEVACGIKMPGGGSLRIRFHGYSQGNEVAVRINGKSLYAQANAAGIVECTVNIDTPHSGHGIWNRAA